VLEVVDGDTPLAFGRGKERALLAVLLVHANEPVSVDRLVDQLWGDSRPETAAKAVQIYVSRLRGRLDPDRIATTPGGYQLRVGEGELDADSFQRLGAEGRSAGDPESAERLLTEALSLWRGPALADFCFERFAQDEIRNLADARLSALEDRVDARIALGRLEEVVPELREEAHA
jgi:DNA-binding SARP family transcriptional activator